MAISLSAGVRASLTSIQQTAALAQQTQLRLATGKRVNSAVDNPVNYFTSEGLNGRAGDLSRLQDQIGLAIKTIEAADKGIKALTKLVETAQGLAQQALQTSDAATARASRRSSEPSARRLTSSRPIPASTASTFSTATTSRSPSTRTPRARLP